MLWLFALCIGLLMGCGTYLVLRPRDFSVALGLVLITYATNLFVFAAGGLRVGGAPVATHGKATTLLADPLPQALVLTAIVIGFAMMALVLGLMVWTLFDLGSERVDAQPRDRRTRAVPSREGQT